MENQKCIICYSTQPRSGEYREEIWTDEFKSLSDFEKECPLAKVIYVFYESDNLLT